MVRARGRRVEAHLDGGALPGEEAAGDPLVILPGRLLRDKGVEDFVEATRLLRAEGMKVRCALVGDRDPENPASVTGDSVCASAALSASFIMVW